MYDHTYGRRSFLGTAAKTMAAGSLFITGIVNAESMKERTLHLIN
jgi:hypothetical protein